MGRMLSSGVNLSSENKNKGSEGKNIRQRVVQFQRIGIEWEWSVRKPYLGAWYQIVAAQNKPFMKIEKLYAYIEHCI